MPKDQSEYTGYEFYWRMYAQMAWTMGITAALTYPFDLFQTRLSSDISPRGKPRLYASTFDCFSQTNVHEGFRKGLYKGLDL